MDPSQIVRSGYNARARPYLEARLRGASTLPLIGEFDRLLSQGSIVVDAGCGAGVPLTKHLATRYRVVGVDFSFSQLLLASQLVPATFFSCQDLSALGLAPASAHGVCSFYAIIHVPRARHHAVLHDIHRVLKPGGCALLCLGAEDLPEDYAQYQGAPMYWSHFDGPTYLSMLAEIGFSIVQHELVPDPIDGTGSHLFVLATKPGA